MLAAALLSLGTARDAAAQCEPYGSPIYKGCLGVGFEGCCTIKSTAIGDITTLQWCQNGWLCMANCAYVGLVNYGDFLWCGWVPQQADGSGAMYDCLLEPSEDPTGQHPWDCQIPCNDIGPEGCCEGQSLLKYCKNGYLSILDCSVNDAKNQFCGWDPVRQSYSCIASPAPGPAGYPYTCGTPTGPQPGCVAKCQDMQCGPDGCGGSCGTCGQGQECLGGTCKCAADCKGKDCGPDGCGGSCGTCPGAMTCTTNQTCAAPPCKPDCNNKQCGDDLCGGFCGGCVPPTTCVWFQCVQPGEDPGPPPDVAMPDAAGPDGAAADAETFGGVRPRCADGFVYRYGLCVPVQTEPVTVTTRGCTAGTAPATGPGALAALLVLAALLPASRRRGRAAALLLALAALPAACARPGEEAWKAEETSPPLVNELAFAPPPEDAIVLRRDYIAGVEDAYALQAGYQLRIRGRLMPAMVTSVSSQVTFTTRVAAVDGDRATLGLAVDSAGVTMDPAVEGAEDEMASGLHAASIRVECGPDRAFLRVSGPASPDGAAPAEPGPAGRDLAEQLRRAVPDLPAAAVAPGDTWGFDAEFRRTLPGDRPAAFVAHGKYRFLGMVEQDVRSLAAIDLLYDVRVSGAGGRDGISGTVGGKGIGKAIFLVEPSTGRVVRSQAVETTRLELELSEGERRLHAEQLARVTIDLTEIEGEP